MSASLKLAPWVCLALIAAGACRKDAPRSRSSAAAPSGLAAKVPSAAEAAAAASELAAPLTDEQIVSVADGLNGGAIAQAKLAQAKSKNSHIGNFAGFMLEDHTEAKQRLDALQLAPADSPLARQLSEQSAQILTMLVQASGVDFDRAYMQAQIDWHQKALGLLKERLVPNAESSTLAEYLRSLEPELEEHLSRAHALQTSMSRPQPAPTSSLPSVDVPGR